MVRVLVRLQDIVKVKERALRSVASAAILFSIVINIPRYSFMSSACFKLKSEKKD